MFAGRQNNELHRPYSEGVLVVSVFFQEPSIGWSALEVHFDYSSTGICATSCVLVDVNSVVESLVWVASCAGVESSCDDSIQLGIGSCRRSVWGILFA